MKGSVRVGGPTKLSGTASASDVVSGKTFYNTDSKTIVTGTLALSGNAAAANVLSGKTFYTTSPTSKLTGTMTNRGAVTSTITPSGNNTATYTIPAGYHNGSGVITANGATAYAAGLSAGKASATYNSWFKWSDVKFGSGGSSSSSNWGTTAGTLSVSGKVPIIVRFKGCQGAGSATIIYGRSNTKILVGTTAGVTGDNQGVGFPNTIVFLPSYCSSYSELTAMTSFYYQSGTTAQIYSQNGIELLAWI